MATVKGKARPGRSIFFGEDEDTDDNAQSDIVARVGGDEFAVFMLDCPVEKAEAPIGRLMKSIVAHNEMRSSAL